MEPNSRTSDPSEALFLGMTVVLTLFAPAVAYQLFPAGMAEESAKLGIATIFFATLPLSASIAAIFGAVHAGILQMNPPGLVAVGVILVGGALAGAAVAPESEIGRANV